MNFIKCPAIVSLDTDLPFWVTADSFNRSFCQADFASRNVLDVVDAYLKEWFDRDVDGTWLFSLPPISVNRGITQFISGRHRTAVLLRHLPRVPLSFDSRWLTHDDRTWIDAVVDEPIDMSSPIDLPDLPVRKVLP
jgi:hypothetical protein